MENGKTYTKMLVPEYEYFFKDHEKIYQDFMKKGLFLLDTVINKIFYSQKNKKLNFYKKLNFSGIFPVRVISLVNKVQLKTK